MAKHLTKKQREAQIAGHASKKTTRREGVRDLIYSYLIVCEGTKSEPNYLGHYVSRKTKVIGADRGTMKLVEETFRRFAVCRQQKSVYRNTRKRNPKV